MAPDKLRLDKWLWAARFFKTRSLAKAAIEGGKVHLGGQRAFFNFWYYWLLHIFSTPERQ